MRLVNEYICRRLHRKESTDVVIQNVLRNVSFRAGGYKEMSSILADLPLVYPEPKCGGGELRGLSQLVQLYTGVQINFGDLTPY